MLASSPPLPFCGSQSLKPLVNPLIHFRNAVEIWECNQVSSESWYFDTSQEQLEYGPNKAKCIDGGDLKPGTKVQIWDW